MARMSEEDRLRRRIAAGAGVQDVERLLAILKGKEAARPADPRRATARVPRCWRRLSQISFSDDMRPDVELLGEHDPHHGLADPRPRTDDAREITGRFPDGRTYLLALSSGNDNYAVDFEVMDWEEGETLIRIEDVDMTADRVEALVRVPDPRHPDEREWDEVLRYVLDFEWVPDAEPYFHVRVEYDPAYVGGGYADVGEFAWVPFDPWFAPDDEDRRRDVALEAFERLVDLPRSCVIAMDLDAMFVRSGDRFVESDEPKPLR